MIRALALFLVLCPTVAAAQGNCLSDGLRALLPGVENWTIPQGAMKPTFEPGACFLSRRPATPEDIAPGRIAVFEEGPAGTVFVFRIVAIGGQTVQMKDGALWIDGDLLERRQVEDYVQRVEPENGFLPRCPAPTPPGETCVIAQWEERLGGSTYRTLDIATQAMDNTGLYRVPEGFVFVLGDNRDNSMDSRFAQAAGGRGYVPIAAIIGLVDEP